MPSPTKEMFKEIVKDFIICWNSPNQFGSIEGKQVGNKCTVNCGSQYFNYKQCHSIVLQAVAFANIWTWEHMVNKVMLEFSNAQLCTVAWKQKV
jgi:hypothetical protein